MNTVQIYTKPFLVHDLMIALKCVMSGKTLDYAIEHGLSPTDVWQSDLFSEDVLVVFRIDIQNPKKII